MRRAFIRQLNGSSNATNILNYGRKFIATGVCLGGFDSARRQSERVPSRNVSFLECIPFDFSWSCQSNVIRCDTGTPETSEEDSGSFPSVERSETEVNTTRPTVDFLPKMLQPFFAFMCWSVVMSIWLAAGLGPLYLLACICLSQWSAAISFLCIWLLGSVMKFPEIPWISHQIASGLELWFSKFAIEYVHPKEYKGRTIYCYHPHGLFSIGAALLAADLIRRGEKIAFVTSSHMRWFNPLAKLMMDIAGIEIVGATPKEVQAAMRKGDRSLILVPGGYEEAVFTQSGFERLFLNTRLGFVKYAMRYGYTLTPVYAYGENDLYTTVSVASGVRDWFAKYKIPIVLFYGHSGMPLMPKKIPLKIVVGEPVYVNRVEDPALGSLRDAHARYVEELMQLYYRYNDDANRPLEIV